ncbi:MAG TPA: hypothetical protein VMK12_02655, partial [Anaeromyxobacteraceae bacterium]|nr:hypothetical protein [Anaeromyxobacteraceae bacterium]
MSRACDDHRALDLEVDASHPVWIDADGTRIGGGLRRSPETSHFCSREPGHSQNTKRALWRAPRRRPMNRVHKNS